VQTKKVLAKAPVKKADSSDSSDSSDEEEQMPPKGGMGMLRAEEASKEMLCGVLSVMAVVRFP